MQGKFGKVGTIDFDAVETLVFAGGGNRCWWQAGVMRQLADHGVRLPPKLVATSAGAGVATSLLVERVDAALIACTELFASNPKVFDWSALAKRKLAFAHQRLYPAWVDAFLSADTFATLRDASSCLSVAVTRPARLFGVSGAVTTGTLAYLADKYLCNSIHPKLPRLLGLRQDFLVLNECADREAAHSLLVAAASAPPIMPARRIEGGFAMDGGYTDNAPIPPQTEAERERTLVMLTRHYSKLPLVFTWEQRTYWQPSRKIPVSTWDCTPKATVREAHDLGVRDAMRVLGAQVIR